MACHEFSETRYEKMDYRRCGRSGLKLPAISLGLFQRLGESGKEDLCREVCYAAFDAGITHFDLANNYGTPPGRSEETFGKILRDMPRDEMIVSTKAGFDMWPGPYGNWGSKKYLIASLDQSLKRMGLDYVDIFYHHRPDPETPLAETLGALDGIVRSGKALYVGLSNYKGAEFSAAVEFISSNNLAPITIHQPKYNLINRNCEADLLDKTDQAGTGVIAYSVLAKGILTDRYLSGIPAGSRLEAMGESGRKQYKKLKQGGYLDKIAKLNAIAQDRGLTLGQLAVAWPLHDSRVTSVLVGVSNTQQLAENIMAVQAPPLTEDELKRIDEIVLT